MKAEYKTIDIKSVPGQYPPREGRWMALLADLVDNKAILMEQADRFALQLTANTIRSSLRYARLRNKDSINSKLITRIVQLENGNWGLYIWKETKEE